MARWTIAVLGIIVLVLGMRQSRLQDKAKADERVATDAEKSKAATEKSATDRSLTEAKTEIVRLKDRVKPRQITEQQKAEMVGILTGSPKGKISILFPTDDSEAYSLSQQIATVLRDAKWDVTAPNAAMHFGAPMVGVKISIRDKTDVPTWLEPMLMALDKGGLSPKWRTNSSLEQNTGEIYVGPKPAK